MCGCGCELGLALAACRADEERRSRAPAGPADDAPRTRTLLERLITAWLAHMVDETPMQRLSRGSGR